MNQKKQYSRIRRLKSRLDLLAEISKLDNSDVDGSYTGTPKDGGEPVQDADDL